jgi:hypothetical protein
MGEQPATTGDRPPAPQLPGDDNIPSAIDPMNLKHGLGDIQTNRGDLHLGGPL